MARKRKSKPTGKKRNHRQKVVENHQKWREEAQLIGAVPTLPEGARRDERVDPATQGAQPLPGLVGRAVRNGWATPEDRKPAIIDELIDIATGRTGEDTEPHVRVMAIRTLNQADKDQWERDNPELAGKTRGGTKVEVNNTNTTQVNLLELAREAAARPDPLEEAKRQALEKRDGEQEKGQESDRDH